MQCTFIGEFKTLHIKRRRLIGSELNRAISSIIDNKVAPSVYRKNEANRLMAEGKII